MTGPIYLYFGLDRQKISLTYFILPLFIFSHNSL